MRWLAQQSGASAYGENAYGADGDNYGGTGFLDTPIPGIPDSLPNTGREAIGVLLALGLFAIAYLVIKKNYDRVHGRS